MKKRMYSWVSLMLALVALAAPAAMASDLGSLPEARPATTVGSDTLAESPTYLLPDFSWRYEARETETAGSGADSPTYLLPDFSWRYETRETETAGSGADSPTYLLPDFSWRYEAREAETAGSGADSPTYLLPDFSWRYEAREAETAGSGADSPTYLLPDFSWRYEAREAETAGSGADSPTYLLPDFSWRYEARGREMYTGHDSPADIDLLAVVRRSTARYQRLAAAEEDGFVPLFECIEHATDGAMGQHYINPDRFDSELKLAQPEALVYEELNNGQFKLVAAEFVIPAAAWSEAEAPTFLGQTLKYKTTVGPHEVDPYYEVHVWVWGHNPSGMFADWNPEVACPS